MRGVQQFPGGQCVGSRSGAAVWWCRYCDGETPGKSPRVAVGISEARSAWVAHAETARHVEAARLIGLVADAAHAAALAAVNSAAKDCSH